MKKTEPTWKRQGFKSSYQYHKHIANKKGYRNPGEYRKDKGIDVIKDEWRIKQRYNECPSSAVEIPHAPNYFATPEGVIWCYSEWRKCWLIISQQPHKSGYLAYQPYCNGKRCVKYSHRSVLAAFKGDRDSSAYECHHIDGDRHNNNIENLMWMERDEHRAMPKNHWK